MISVDGLVGTPSLGLGYLAGASGGSRLVTWAHSCDLPDPWRWSQPGQLVMINCGGLPKEPERQREWLSRLIDCEVTALAISARPGSHKITDEFLAVADERGFPVLEGSWDLEFVALARTVIESAMQTERRRLASTTRLYDAYWQELRGRVSFGERLGTLERLLGCRLHIVDKRNRRLLASGRSADAAGGDGHRPAGLFEPDDGDVVVTVPARRPALLVARPSRRPVLDNGLLQHLSGLVALEFEHQAIERDRLRASGSEIFHALLDGDLEYGVALPELRNRGLTDPLVVVCWGRRGRPGPGLEHDDVHLHAGFGPVNPLLLYRDDCLLGAVTDNEELFTAVAEELGTCCVAGVSARLSSGNGIIEATRQAKLAMGLAIEAGVRLRRYGEAQSVTGLVPRSVDEARRLVRDVLGPLIDHDAAHGTDLTGTLFAFLRNDRAWRATAEKLSIHRQTLVHRMRRTEEILGFKPTSTAASAILWQAFEAARHTGLTPWPAASSPGTGEPAH